MRLKSLTTLNTLLLLSVCLALGATLWWSEQALERPYQLIARYLGLSQQFQHQVAANIHEYLASGDAMQHSQALQTLDDLLTEAESLPEHFATQLRPSLVKLRNFTAGDLLAAGKLASDPQGLLIQAEREISTLLDQLSRYAEKANVNNYQISLFAASQALQHLSYARDRLVSTGRDDLAGEVEQALLGLKDANQRLQDLPLQLHICSLSVLMIFLLAGKGDFR
ncbi:hypothetical protein [Azomonas macrocytogenes]|uniref:Chemotaxis protein n=1 Tax=Azomonas macrocytogenes TaxID=69962 RepID=A0A839T7F2_AZOMA|nr:hypothetical protein [Azomonas macrocytogenes]MBB3105401.1 hypothetical protein [Azomonas macrocytogenes]